MIRPGSRGVLWILALFLAASGALRIGSEVGLAFAKAGPDAPGTTGTAPPLVCEQPPAALAAALTLREEKVAASESVLAERVAALALAEEAATARLAELESAESRLRGTLALADGAAEDDLLRLTAVYETMKPKDAARLFEAMTPEFAAGFLGRMRPDAAAAVFSGMSPQASYAVSAILAGRNAAVPKE